MATERSLYDILGVSSSASQEQIRSAYRELARTLHPDVLAREPQRAQSSVSMAEVNRAWSVLSQPESRRQYDQQRLRSSSDTSTTTPRASASSYSPPAPLAPVRFPWRAMLVVAALASVVVLVLNGFSDPPAPGVPDQLLEPGSCVVIDRERFAVEVSCSGPHDYVVRQFIALDRTCPRDSESFRDRQGMGLACVDAATPSNSVVTGSSSR